MEKFTFTADTFTCNGKTFPARYETAPDGAIIVVTFTEESAKRGKEIRVKFLPDHAAYSAALAAAEGTPAPDAATVAEEQEPAATEQEPAAEDPAPAKIPEGYTATTTAAGNIITVSTHIDATEQEPAAEDPAPVPDAVTVAAEQEPAADPIPEGKQTRGPVPEKTFINDSITGKGWRIYFDGNTARTRVIFDADPTAAARAAVEKAGFYFSAAMNSWNKKLTFKAYRAAVALSGELSALYA